MKFVPEPVVWSAEGPVLLLGVAPEPSSHSKSSLLALFVDHWGQDPTKSTSQSSWPMNKNSRYLYLWKIVILVQERINKSSKRTPNHFQTLFLLS